MPLLTDMPIALALPLAAYALLNAAALAAIISPRPSAAPPYAYGESRCRCRCSDCKAGWHYLCLRCQG